MQNSEDGVLDSVYKWGSSWLNYAQEQLNTFLSPDTLQVVDPDAEQAQSAEELVNPEDQRQQMWSTLQQYIGEDVMSLMSVPVWIMEPFTVLQKMAEIMEYTELLDKADQATSPAERLAYVTAFAITPYGAIERAWKPFNPILGETFELQCGSGVKFLAEQVSHHPPIGAAHAENDHFTYDIVSAPRTKFMGNSTDIYPYGRTHVKLKKSGEIFSIVPPTSKVCNLIIGRTWIDTFGTMKVINNTTGDTTELEFTQCGWFGSGRYEFAGNLMVNGEVAAQISGKWNSHCYILYKGSSDPQRLWQCSEKPEDDVYERTHFCFKCSSCSDIPAPLPTDSRRRPDLDALDKGDSGKATLWKHRLEEMQRAEKREREKRGETWSPKWFDPSPDGPIYAEEYTEDDVPSYKWKGSFPQSNPIADPGRISFFLCGTDRLGVSRIHSR